VGYIRSGVKVSVQGASSFGCWRWRVCAGCIQVAPSCVFEQCARATISLARSGLLGCLDLDLDLHISTSSLHHVDQRLHLISILSVILQEHGIIQTYCPTEANGQWLILQATSRAQRSLRHYLPVDDLDTKCISIMLYAADQKLLLRHLYIKAQATVELAIQWSCPTHAAEKDLQSLHYVLRVAVLCSLLPQLQGNTHPNPSSALHLSGAVSWQLLGLIGRSGASLLR
jgi:hypothetical protein